MAGKPFPESVTKSILLTLQDGTYELQNDKGNVQLFENGKMEITGTSGPNNGKTLKAIYRIDGDELVICYDLSGSDYPASFATAASTQLFLVKYSRLN